MMIDRALVEHKLALIDDCLVQLDVLSLVSREEFVEDKKACGAAESYLWRALQAVLQTAEHIRTVKGHTGPAGEDPLVQEYVLSPGLKDALATMAAFRHRLGALNPPVTDDELYSILTNRPWDIREMTRQLRDLVSGF